MDIVVLGLGDDVEVLGAGGMEVVHVCSFGRARAERREVVVCEECRGHLDGWGRNLGPGK